MKKIFAISFALVLTLALAAPALATDVDTGVTVSSGGGTIPIVKCKWEQEPVAVEPDLESGDPSHSDPGFQIDPPMVKCATKTIEYYAVVTDEEDMGDVYEVFAIVYHPDGSPAPYNASDPYWGPYFKYKVVFEKIGCESDAIALVNDAYDADLITFGDGYDINEITNGIDGELDKCTAALWKGTEIIDYEQPAGDYQIDVYAVDTNNNPSLVLTNYFEYVSIAGIEVDFDSLTYGSVNLNSTKKIAGDITWDSPIAAAPKFNKATVRNIGNTWTHVKVQQSDMGFGKAGSSAGTAIQSYDEADMENSNWNVYFGARMGTKAAWKWYDPNVEVTLAEYLCLSTQDELDFAIRVKNGFEYHSGIMTLSAVMEPFSPDGTCQGYDSPCDSYPRG